MNRITINDVTIEVPTDMDVRIVRGFVSITHNGAQAVLDKPVVSVDIKKEVAEDVSARPDSVISNLILKHLKSHEGRGYTIGITRGVTAALKMRLATYSVKQRVKKALAKMLDDGTVVILKGNDIGHKLYGLTSMQEPSSRAVAPWNQAQHNNNHEVLHD